MVQMPPTFGRLLPRLEEVAETETLDLRCKLDGSPVPTVTWFKDGEPLVADHHVNLTANPDGTVRLLIENVKPTDCGAYKLVAENQNGSTAAICAVAVRRKSALAFKPHKSSEVLAKNRKILDILFSCRISGNQTFLLHLTSFSQSLLGKKLKNVMGLSRFINPKCVTVT